jgi:hypothetical protein
MSTSLNANQKGNYNINAPPHSLKDSNASPKVKIMEEKKVSVRFLTCSISKVKRHARILKWGLGQMISGSIIHMDLYNLNNKLVSASLEHF